MPRIARFATAVVAGLVVAGWLVSPVAAADRIYWVNDGAPNRISYASLGGSGGGNLSIAGATDGTTRGLAFDVAAGRVYWTNRSGNRVSSANLDGSGGGRDLNTGTVTVSGPNAAAVHAESGLVYWANEFSDRISFARLDNSGAGGDLNTSGATLDLPIAPVVDPASGRVFWGNGGSVNVISFAALDASGGQDLNTDGATVSNPHGLAIDPVANRIYWANQAGNSISFANLDGSGGGDLNTTGATVNVPIGVAIDPGARRIYWGNWGADSLSYAGLDGSGGADLSLAGPAPNNARSPVLLKAPSGTGIPVITGGTSGGGTLSCSQGSWAPDLPGSWLYRSPQRLAYSWTLDGAPIPGATGNTTSATAAGEYRCITAASNPAGGSSQTSAAHVVSAAPASPGTPSTPSTPKPDGAAKPPPAFTPLRFGAGTRVSVTVTARRASRRGLVTVVIGNANGFSVSGTLAARTGRRAAAARRTSFTVGARAERAVSLRLSSSARRALRLQRRLPLRLLVEVADPAGNVRTVTKTATLRPRTS